MRATSHRVRAALPNAKAHLRAIHIVRDDKKSDMAYTSASTALYHAESDHAKHNAPDKDAMEIDRLRQMFLPVAGHIQRIKEIETEQSIITANEVKSPAIILMTLT